MRLESGPAGYDRNYNLVIMLVGILLGAYFLYDYQIGYPKKNLEAAQKALTPLLGAKNVPTELSEHPTGPEIEDLKKELNEISSRPVSPNDIRTTLGEPLFAMPNEDGTGALEHFVSIYGMARVPITHGRVDPALIHWQPWEKSKDEIRLQLYCAIVTFAFALFMFTRVYRAAALRVVIDDEGLTYAKRRIPFDNMVRLCDYSRKGWVDLYYRHGPQERKLRIDNQKVRKFDEIIDTLCAAKGFEDPRTVSQEVDAEETKQSVEELDQPDDSAASVDGGGAHGDEENA